MNIKWVLLGLGCFTIFVGIIIAFILFLTSMFKGEAYELSLEALNNNDVIIKEIGTPIEPGYFVLGNISVNGASGYAKFDYSIKGSIASGRAYVFANKHAGLWSIEELIVSNTSNGERYTVIEQKN